MSQGGEVPPLPLLGGFPPCGFGWFLVVWNPPPPLWVWVGGFVQLLLVPGLGGVLNLARVGLFKLNMVYLFLFLLVGLRTSVVAHPTH